MINDQLILIPYIQIGELKFGMPRNDVRKLLGEFREFMYGYPIEDNHGDDFLGHIHGLYDKNLTLEAVEFFYPFEFIYSGNTIKVGKNANELIIQLRSITDDVKIITEDESFSTEKLGFIVYCPENIIEEVLFFRKDYYNE